MKKVLWWKTYMQYAQARIYLKPWIHDLRQKNSNSNRNYRWYSDKLSCSWIQYRHWYICPAKFFQAPIRMISTRARIVVVVLSVVHITIAGLFYLGMDSGLIFEWQQTLLYWITDNRLNISNSCTFDVWKLCQ